MISVLALGAAQLEPNHYVPGSDPGLLGLAIRAVEHVRSRRKEVFEKRVAAFIEANGSFLSDEVERRIGESVLSGRI